MSAPAGVATFPGVNQIDSASITFSPRGRSPSVAQLNILPQPGYFAEGGTLRFVYGSVVVEWPKCKVDSAQYTLNESGELIGLQIFDRRWMWRFGTISGIYNVRGADGNVRAATKKTPQQLAQLCLTAMGEEGFDVSDLPNDSQPFVEWDHVNPSEALVDLVTDLGCDVFLGLDNKVSIRVVGDGETLSVGDGAIENHVTVDPPEKPDAVAVVTGEVLIQGEFELEAVAYEPKGEERGKYVTQDNASYKPAGGWASADMPYYMTVTEDSRETARDCIYRTYRIKTPFEIPGYGTVPDLDHLEIEDEKAELINDGKAVGEKIENTVAVRRIPAQVKGIWFPNKEDLKNSQVKATPEFDAEAIYTRGFQIDAAAGVVKFDEPCYRNTSHTAAGVTPTELTRGEATMRLITCVRLKDKDHRAPKRYVRERKTGARYGTKTQEIHHAEITPVVVVKYDNGYKIAGVDSNVAAVNAECDYWLDVELRKYETQSPQTVRYLGLVPLRVDGATAQITFSVSSGGCDTTISRNNEHDLDVPPYAEKRRLEKEKAWHDRLRRIKQVNHGNRNALGIVQKKL